MHIHVLATKSPDSSFHHHIILKQRIQPKGKKASHNVQPLSPISATNAPHNPKKFVPFPVYLGSPNPVDGSPPTQRLHHARNLPPKLVTPQHS